MNFFEHQEKARRNTRLLVFLFILAVVGIATSIYVATEGAIGMSACKDKPNCQFSWWDPLMFLYVFGGTVGFVGLASGFRILSLRSGGSAVAEMMGGCHPHAARGLLIRLERAGRIRRAIGNNGRYVQRSIVFIAPSPQQESMDGSHPNH